MSLIKVRFFKTNIQTSMKQRITWQKWAELQFLNTSTPMNWMFYSTDVCWRAACSLFCAEIHFYHDGIGPCWPLLLPGSKSKTFLFLIKEDKPAQGWAVRFLQALFHLDRRVLILLGLCVRREYYPECPLQDEDEDVGQGHRWGTGSPRSALLVWTERPLMRTNRYLFFTSVSEHWRR